MQSEEMFGGVPKPCPLNMVHCRPVAQQRGACQSVAAGAHTKKTQLVLNRVSDDWFAVCGSLFLVALRLAQLHNQLLLLQPPFKHTCAAAGLALCSTIPTTLG